nr:winged helix-turn-helix domain-containing protein [Naumannella cuiyingiana]
MSPVRIAILSVLARQSDLTIGEIADATALSRPTIGPHLGAMLTAGLIRTDQPDQQALGGRRVRYSANTAEVRRQIAQLMGTLAPIPPRKRP